MRSLLAECNFLIRWEERGGGGRSDGSSEGNGSRFMMKEMIDWCLNYDRTYRWFFFVGFWKEVYYCDAICLYVHMYVCASCLFNNWNLQAVELLSRFWSCDQFGAGTICFFFFKYIYFCIFEQSIVGCNAETHIKPSS